MSDFSVAERPITNGDLTVRERAVLCATIDFAQAAAERVGASLDCELLGSIRRKLSGDGDLIVLPDIPGAVELTRAQEHAADAMAALHGRSYVQPQADGAVVITGLLDDLEREKVCIETDGRERWRA